MPAIDITFPSGQIELAGTLLTPDSSGSSANSGPQGPLPAAVLVSGSGPIDRDSNMRKLRIQVMAKLARHLADAGMASLRYDKRGVGDSGGDYQSAGLFDNIADARAAVEALRQRPEIDPARVVVIGHSEGALIATELAADVDGLAGAVLLAGSATTGKEILQWQIGQVAGALPRPVRAILRLFRVDLAKTQTKRLAQLEASTEDVIRIQLVKVNAKWFREFLAHDPAITLRRVTAPILAIAGSKDIQVDPTDAERICRATAGPCQHRLVPGVTHLLRPELGEPSLRTYKKQAKQPLDPDVVELVTTWAVERTRPVERTGAVERTKTVEPGEPC